MIELPQIPVQRLAIKLKATAEKFVKQGHPWVFEDSILKQNKEGKAGDLAILFDAKRDKVFGVGLYDPASPIRIKIIANQPQTIDPAFFEEVVKKAYDHRKPLLKTTTNGYRLLFGENDGLPGLIADVYGEVMVVKLYSAIWYPYLKYILPALLDQAKSNTIVLRMSRLLQKEQGAPFYDGQVIHGTLENAVVHFLEHGVHFSANVIKGHKTGYFLDHRHNRKRVGELAKGKTVLDVFSYAGGFSVHALAGGAAEVTSLDISAQALSVALENGRLNEHQGKHFTIADDAFLGMQCLIDEQRYFDIVVIDPPSFAKSAREVEMAKKSYHRLVRLGVQLVQPRGLLVMASCSSRIPSEVFFETVAQALDNSARDWKSIAQSFHDLDHPIRFKEGAYLKTGYYRIT